MRWIKTPVYFEMPHTVNSQKSESPAQTIKGNRSL